MCRIEWYAAMWQTVSTSLMYAGVFASSRIVEGMVNSCRRSRWRDQTRATSTGRETKPLAAEGADLLLRRGDAIGAREETKWRLRSFDESHEGASQLCRVSAALEPKF